ncbi:MFS transporter [Actinoplanes sp. NPDC051494]|uniref:MFS transporter n=1 Tax=Actinoplanes sp. NPDC051494 TaxID=3363907 RepID=UPI00379C603E
METSRRRWTLLVTVSAGLLLITLDNSILYTALPTLTADLGATPGQALWIINAYPLVMAGLLLGSGTLGDRIGHRRMFTAGLVVFGVASLLAAFAPGAGALIAARALLAAGAAAMMPATLALIRVTFTDERERNLAIAVWGSLAVVGAALGPIVGGVVLEFFWWGAAFLINVPVAVAALIAVPLVAPRDVPDAGARWDVISSGQAMLGLTGAVFAIKELAHVPPSWPVVLAGTAAAVLGGTLFVRRQRRLADPLLDLAIFRNPAFTSGVLAAAFAMFALAGIQLVATQRYQAIAGFTPLQSGLLVAALALGCLPTALLGGAVLHRTGLRPLIAGGLALAVPGVLLAALGPAAGLGVLIPGLVLTGMGLGAVMAVASSAILGNVPARRAGMASSVEEVSYEFGSLVAVALLGSLLDLVRSAGADRTTAAAFDSGYVAVLLVVAAVLAGGAAVTGRLLRHHGPQARRRTPALTAEGGH